MELNITTIIIIITALISISGFSNEKIINDLIFHPPSVAKRNQWYRFFTCGLIHADYMHLIFNMVSLYFFGPFIEKVFTLIFLENGKWLYLLLYVSALLICLIPTYFKHKDDYNYYSLGASGAVSAVIFVGLIVAPENRIGFFFIPPIIPGFIYAPLYLILTAWMDKAGKDNINHSAHLWGALYGVAFIFVAGKIAGYDVIDGFIEGVKFYFKEIGRSD